MDIIFGFEPKVGSSNLPGGTKNFGVGVKISYLASNQGSAGSSPAEGTRPIYMNTKKIFFTVVIFCLLSVIFIPFSVRAACGDGSGIVNCGCASDGSDACKLTDFFTMIIKIYDFIVKYIAAPLATIAILVGAIFMMISAGDPGWFGLGKKILWAGIIGLVLALGSKAIINFILGAIGATPISYIYKLTSLF